MLNPGSQAPNKPSQKLPLIRAEHPSASWVKTPKPSSEGNDLKACAQLFFTGWSTRDAVCPLILAATPTVCTLPPGVHGRHCALSTVQDSVWTDERLSMEAFC